MTILLALIGGVLMTTGAILVQPSDRPIIRRVIIAWTFSFGIIFTVLGQTING